MVKIVTAEEEEEEEELKEEELAASEENEILVDFPRSSSYEAYFSSQSKNRSPPDPYYYVLSPPPILPLWDFRPDIHIPPVPPCYVTKIRSPRSSWVVEGTDLCFSLVECSLYDFKCSIYDPKSTNSVVKCWLTNFSVVDLTDRFVGFVRCWFNGDFVDDAPCFNPPPNDAPCFNPPPRQLPTVTVAQTSPPERRMQDANSVTIKATYGTDTIIKFDLPSPATMDDLEGEVAKRLKLNVGSFAIKYQDQDGEWISITGCDDLQYCIRTPRSVATIRMLVLSFVFLGDSQVCFLHETPMQHMPEFFQEDALFFPPQSQQLTTGTVLQMNQQSSSRSMSELTEQSQSLVCFPHETPIQHMPEFVQEDFLIFPPQSEQLTTDTVFHMNHTFPPESTRQEEFASRGTEKIDNMIRKCNSFELAVEGEAINIDEGGFGSASQTVDANDISLKKNKRKISTRSIEREDLRPYLGKSTREEAAKSLGVTGKRVCRDHKIPRSYRKRNKDEYSSPSELKGAKTGPSVQSSLTMPFRGALPSKPLIQAAVQFFQSDAPSFNPPPRQLSTVTVAQTSPPERGMQDAYFVTIKATYDGTNTIIKFDLPSSATMDDLEVEVAKRLKLNIGSFAIKYQDQEGEWISITGYNDLQYCIRTLRSLATVKMLVQSTTSRPT